MQKGPTAVSSPTVLSKITELCIVTFDFIILSLILHPDILYSYLNNSFSPSITLLDI